jgi:hypothetical protein
LFLPAVFRSDRIVFTGVILLEQFSDLWIFYRQIGKVGLSNCFWRIVLQDRREVVGHQIGCHHFLFAVEGFVIVRSDRRRKGKKKESDRLGRSCLTNIRDWEVKYRDPAPSPDFPSLEWQSRLFPTVHPIEI